MKRTLMAQIAMGIAFALLITSTVMASGNEDAPQDMETDEYDVYDPVNYLDLEQGLEFEPEDPGDGAYAASPGFDPLVNRTYTFLTWDVISDHLRWDQLPGVKTIFTANSSGEWMYKALPRINQTGEARIVDQDGDGYPELVIWKHYSRGRNMTLEDANITMEEASELLESEGLAGIGISWIKGFTLVYVDRDGDGNPEFIQLSVVKSYKMFASSGNIPVFVHHFRWKGRTSDRDSDGDWEVQSFETGTHSHLNLNADRYPEFVRDHSADYWRGDLRGRSLWDRIRMKASSSKVLDRNSDGSPEMKRTEHVRGSWSDQNGQHHIAW